MQQKLIRCLSEEFRKCGKGMIGIMNRQEFMERLENLLQNIPEQERIEALQYYNDYFDDAGVENEQAVLDALGTPAQVAENIKRDLNQNRYAYGEEQEKMNLDKEIVKYQPENQANGQAPQPKQGLSAGIIVLIVILCILASPVLLTVFGTVFCVLIAVLGIWFAIVLGLGSMAFGLMLGGIAMVVVGIWAFMLHPLLGIAFAGAGCLILAAGVLCMMLEVLVVGKLTPALFKGIGWIFRKLTGKKKAI